MDALKEAKEESATDKDGTKDSDTVETIPLFSEEKSPGEVIFSSLHSNNNIDKRKSQLKNSKSVPLFEDKYGDQSPGSLAGSENDLYGVTLEENGLPLAKSYRCSGPKVQFAEGMSSSTNGIYSPKKKQTGRKRLRTTSEASSISVTSGTSTSSPSLVPLDGGYGWVIVAASFFVNMIADGVTFSFGIMFEEWQNEFNSSSAATAGVVSVFHSVPLLTGPLATWLTDRYGCKLVTIAGALMAAIGFLLAAFSHHIILLYFFFGVVAGFGLSLCYVAAIIIVAYYFDRRRSFATGISVCGSGVGTFVFAPFTQYLLDTFDGWRGACIVLAGIFLNMVVCGMLFRDLEWTRGSKKSKSTAKEPRMPEIEELKLALEGGNNLTALLEEEDEACDKDEHLASSLINFPTYIKNASLLPEDILDQLIKDKKSYQFFLDNFPDSLQDPESKGKKLKRKVSSLFKRVDLSEKGRDQQRLELLRVRRQSLTYHSKVAVRMKSSASCPDIYKETFHTLEEGVEEERRAGYFTFNFITIPFSVFCLSNFILYFWYDVPYVYSLEFAENELNIPNSQSTQILSAIGILNTFGEVFVGWLSDQPWVSTPLLYCLCLLVCGLVTALIPLAPSLNLTLLLSGLYGLCISANYSLTSPLLINLVSIDHFTKAYGLLLAAQGVGNLLGPPLAGWLYDVSKQWFLTFGLAGFFIALSGAMLLVLPATKLVKGWLVTLRESQTRSENQCPDQVTV